MLIYPYFNVTTRVKLQLQYVVTLMLPRPQTLLVTYSQSNYCWLFNFSMVMNHFCSKTLLLFTCIELLVTLDKKTTARQHDVDVEAFRIVRLLPAAVPILHIK